MVFSFERVCCSRTGVDQTSVYSSYSAIIVSLIWERYCVFSSEFIELYARKEHCSYSGPLSSKENTGLRISRRTLSRLSSRRWRRVVIYLDRTSRACACATSYGACKRIRVSVVAEGFREPDGHFRRHAGTTIQQVRECLVWCLTNTLTNLRVLLAVGCVALPRVVHATARHRALPTTKMPSHLHNRICETPH